MLSEEYGSNKEALRRKLSLHVRNLQSIIGNRAEFQTQERENVG